MIYYTNALIFSIHNNFIQNATIKEPHYQYLNLQMDLNSVHLPKNHGINQANGKVMTGTNLFIQQIKINFFSQVIKNRWEY